MTEHENFLAAIKTEIHELVKNPNFIRHVSEFEKLLPPDVEFQSFDDEVKTAYRAYEPDPAPSPLSLLLPPLLDQCIEPQAMTPEQHTDDADVNFSAKCFLLAVLYGSRREPLDEPIITQKDAAAAVWGFYGQLTPRAEYERGARVRAFIRRAVEDVKKVVNRKFPLSKRAAIIYEKLDSLPPYKGMTTSEIQDFFFEQTGKNLDEGTWKKHRKELETYGLKNARRIGYYIEK